MFYNERCSSFCLPIQLAFRLPTQSSLKTVQEGVELHMKKTSNCCSGEGGRFVIFRLLTSQFFFTVLHRAGVNHR